MSRPAGWFLVLVMVVCPFAPAAGGEAPVELVVGLEGAPKLLDPRLAQDAYSVRILSLIFEGLTRIGKNSEPEPCLAESWELVDEAAWLYDPDGPPCFDGESFTSRDAFLATRPLAGLSRRPAWMVELDRALDPNPRPVAIFNCCQARRLTYVFHLARGRRFPDGTEVTSEDVVATIVSLADPELGSPSRYLLDKIADVRALSDYDVMIGLREPFAPLINSLTFGIIPAEVARREVPAPEFLPGSGPYQVETHKPGERVVLSLNPHYHGPRPNFDRIVFRVLEDDVTRVLALEHGEVHLLQNSVPPDDIPLLEKDPDISLVMEQGVNYSYIGVNFEDPILANLLVRKAIAHAIDREKIAGCLLNDSVSLASGILPSTHWAYNPEVAAYHFDPELAMELLDRAGYDDPDGDGPLTRFDLVFKTSQNKVRRWIVEAIADQLGRVGIGVEARSLEFGTFFDDIKKGRFQMYSLTWTGVTEPDLYLWVFNSESFPPKGGNRNRYVNAEVDRLTEQGRLSLDREERRAAYLRIQEIVSDELPYISLWHGKNVAASHRSLKGFEFYPGGDYHSLATARWEEGERGSSQ